MTIIKPNNQYKNHYYNARQKNLYPARKRSIPTVIVSFNIIWKSQSIYNSIDYRIKNNKENSRNKILEKISNKTLKKVRKTELNFIKIKKLKNNNNISEQKIIDQKYKTAKIKIFKLKKIYEQIKNGKKRPDKFNYIKKTYPFEFVFISSIDKIKKDVKIQKEWKKKFQLWKHKTETKFWTAGDQLGHTIFRQPFWALPTQAERLLFIKRTKKKIISKNNVINWTIGTMSNEKIDPTFRKIFFNKPTIYNETTLSTALLERAKKKIEARNTKRWKARIKAQQIKQVKKKSLISFFWRHLGESENSHKIWLLSGKNPDKKQEKRIPQFKQFGQRNKNKAEIHYHHDDPANLQFSLPPVGLAMHFPSAFASPLGWQRSRFASKKSFRTVYYKDHLKVTRQIFRQHKWRAIRSSFYRLKQLYRIRKNALAFLVDKKGKKYMKFVQGGSFKDQSKTNFWKSNRLKPLLLDGYKFFGQQKSIAKINWPQPTKKNKKLWRRFISESMIKWIKNYSKREDWLLQQFNLQPQPKQTKPIAQSKLRHLINTQNYQFQKNIKNFEKNVLTKNNLYWTWAKNIRLPDADKILNPLIARYQNWTNQKKTSFRACSQVNFEICSNNHDNYQEFKEKKKFSKSKIEKIKEIKKNNVKQNVQNLLQQQPALQRLLNIAKYNKYSLLKNTKKGNQNKVRFGIFEFIKQYYNAIFNENKIKKINSFSLTSFNSGKFGINKRDNQEKNFYRHSTFFKGNKSKNDITKSIRLRQLLFINKKNKINIERTKWKNFLYEKKNNKILDKNIYNFNQLSIIRRWNYILNRTYLIKQAKRENILASYINAETDLDSHAQPSLYHINAFRQVYILGETFEKENQKKNVSIGAKKESFFTPKQSGVVITHFPYYFMNYPRFKDKLVKQIRIPEQKRPGGGSQGKKTARVFKEYYEKPLLDIIEKKIKPCREARPFRFNSPFSLRWTRLARIHINFNQVISRGLRWGPDYQKEVLDRIKKNRLISPFYQARRYLYHQKISNRQKVYNPHFTLGGSEWWSNLWAQHQRISRWRRRRKSYIWLNRIMTSTQKDARVNMAKGIISYAKRTRRFIMRRRRIKSALCKRRKRFQFCLYLKRWLFFNSLIIKSY